MDKLPTREELTNKNKYTQIFTGYLSNNTFYLYKQRQTLEEIFLYKNTIGGTSTIKIEDFPMFIFYVKNPLTPKGNKLI